MKSKKNCNQNPIKRIIPIHNQANLNLKELRTKIMRTNMKRIKMKIMTKKIKRINEIIITSPNNYTLSSSNSV